MSSGKKESEENSSRDNESPFTDWEELVWEKERRKECVRGVTARNTKKRSGSSGNLLSDLPNSHQQFISLPFIG